MPDGSSTSVDSGGVPTPWRNRGKRGWGIDEPRTVIELFAAGILSVVVGVIISAYTSASSPRTADLGLLIGPAVGFLIFVLASALYWSSRSGKVREVAKMVGNIPWGGGEVVLDVGCGRGLAMVDSAKKLEDGVVIGVDLWQRARLSGNDPKSIWANAAAAGVDAKVAPVKGVSLLLPVADGKVDVIVSGLSVHRLAQRKEREALFTEFVRVLKEGGRVAILDAGNGAEYMSIFKRVGMSDVQMHSLRFSSFRPFHVVMARKPYGA